MEVVLSVNPSGKCQAGELSRNTLQECLLETGLKIDWERCVSVCGIIKKVCITCMYVSMQFQRGSNFGNSTHREDFQRYLPQHYQPDVSTRRRGLLRNDVSVCVFRYDM